MMKATLRIHLKRDGTIHLYGKTARGPQWCRVTLSILENELLKLKRDRGEIIYSQDRLKQSEHSEKLEEISKLIMSFELSIKVIFPPREKPIPRGLDTLQTFKLRSRKTEREK
jgi:hypothetical protein